MPTDNSKSTNLELKTKRLGSPTKRNVLLAPTMIESKASAFQSKLRHSSVGHGLQKEWFSRRRMRKEGTAMRANGITIRPIRESGARM